MQVRLDVVRGREAPAVMDVAAESIEAARQQAQRNGYSVLSARTLNNGPGTRRWARARPSSSRSRGELAVFAEQVHALLQAGLSVSEALETLQRGAAARWAGIIGGLVDRLREGQPLSQAMAREAIFPPLLIALVRASEITSDLPQALERFLDHEKRSSQIRHQITSVALYPALIMAVGGAVLVFLMLYVMPRFARVFEGMGGDLPWSARAMVAWSALLKAHGPLLGLIAVLLIAMLAAVLWSPSVRHKAVSRLMQSPAVSSRLRVYFLARWYRTTAMLVDGGIPLPESLGLAAHVLPASLAPAGLQAERFMREGMSPSAAYQQARMATPVADQLLRAGERSGDVGIMLKRAAEFHEADITRTLEKAMKVIEPLVMTFIGIGVGGVVILMYLPIFELASSIQ